MPRPTSQDLAGFWDLLQLSIDDVTVKFDQLQQIKNNNWRLIDSPEKKVRASVAPGPNHCYWEGVHNRSSHDRRCIKMTAVMGWSWGNELEQAAPDHYLGWFRAIFFTTSICDYRLSFTATSSRTKEDGSTEERDNEGEIPGPPWQAPTGGPPAPHGSQAGGLLPAELGVGAGGQHRDLYSRSSDETLRRRGPWPRLLPLFPLLTVLILRLFFKTASLSVLSLLHPLSGLNKPSSASFAKRRRSVGCARVSVGLTWVGWESAQLAGADDADDDDAQSTHPPIYCP